MILRWILLVIFGYLCGSVMFCNIIARKFGKKDIRKVSKDGNPGAANVFWHCGWKLGALGLVLDILKGLLPVFLARVVMGGGFEGGFGFGVSATESIWFAFVMLAPVLGHAFPIFEKFRGGKCISTTFGVTTGLLGLSPAVFVLGALDLFFSFVVKIKAGNMRALVFYSLFIVAMAVICVLNRQPVIFLGCLMFSVLTITRHLPLTSDKKVVLARKER